MLDRDSYLIDDVKKQVTKELRHSDLAARFLERAQAGTKYTTLSHQDQYAAYFANFSQDLEVRMQYCRQSIDELESNIRMVSHSHHISPKVIQDIIRSQHSTFLSVASKIATVHDAVERHREKFLEYRSKYVSNDISIPGLYPEERAPMQLSAIASTLLPTVNQTVAGQPTQSKPPAAFPVAHQPAIRK